MAIVTQRKYHQQTAISIAYAIKTIGELSRISKLELPEFMRTELELQKLSAIHLCKMAHQLIAQNVLSLETLEDEWRAMLSDKEFTTFCERFQILDTALTLETPKQEN